MIWIYIYLFIGFITSLAIREFCIMASNEEFDDEILDSLDANTKCYMDLLSNNQKVLITFIIFGSLVWPWIWITIKPKYAVMLICGFVYDLIKGHH